MNSKTVLTPQVVFDELKKKPDFYQQLPEHLHSQYEQYVTDTVNSIGEKLFEKATLITILQTAQIGQECFIEDKGGFKKAYIAYHTKNHPLEVSEANTYYETRLSDLKTSISEWIKKIKEASVKEEEVWDGADFFSSEVIQKIIARKITIAEVILYDSKIIIPDYGLEYNYLIC